MLFLGFVSRPTVLVAFLGNLGAAGSTHRKDGHMFARSRVASEARTNRTCASGSGATSTEPGWKPRESAQKQGARLCKCEDVPPPHSNHSFADGLRSLWLCGTHTGYVRSWTLEQHGALHAPHFGLSKLRKDRSMSPQNSQSPVPQVERVHASYGRPSLLLQPASDRQWQLLEILHARQPSRSSAERGHCLFCGCAKCKATNSSLRRTALMRR